MARRTWRLSQDQNDWETALACSKRKRNLIKEAKRADFRRIIHDTTQGEGIWRLAKWGKGSSNTISSIPPLFTKNGLAESKAQKAKALRDRFYPKVEADLSDIEDLSFCPESFPNTIQVECLTDYEEVRATLSQRASLNAPGPDELPYAFLKAMGPPLVRAVVLITNACWTLGHFPKSLKKARTIVIRKPNKDSYQEAGSWRPIALLSTIGKIVETLTAKKIRAVAEKHNLIPEEQMGGRSGRSTETALDLLTSQVRTVWDANRVATLLSIDISGAFDTVHHVRLLDVLRKKGLPYWLVKWVQSFLAERTTSLLLCDFETDQFEVKAGVPQGSPLSPILFMLYNSELFDICRRPFEGISSVGFADDLNVLAYSRSTEANCQKLEGVHRKCLEWARRFGMRFAPQKYELIHFTTATKRFNLQATVNFDGVV
jgi:hypothetical protein